MSKASSTPITPDDEIRQAFSEFVRSLPQSGFLSQDPKTGFMRRVRRQLSEREQQQFIRSLPTHLQEHIEQRNAARRSEAEDWEYEPTDESDGYEESDDQVDLSRNRLDEADLVSYETFLHMDIAEVPYSVQETLSDDEMEQLTSSPAFRAREYVFERPPRKKLGKKSREALQANIQLKLLALKRLAKAQRLINEEILYRQREFVQYIEKRIIYLENNPH